MKKGILVWVWPPILDFHSAEKTARQGFWAACFITAVTAISTAVSGTGFDSLAYYVQVAIWAIIARGIFKISRFAAVAGLVLYLFDRTYMWYTVGSKSPVMALLFTLMFVNSVRGTFGYYRLCKNAKNNSTSI